MEVLARNAGKAVAETDLVREVWGAYRQENTTTVRRYIFLLRKKIEPQPDEPRYILTVRGYGYRLEGGKPAHILIPPKENVSMPSVHLGKLCEPARARQTQPLEHAARLAWAALVAG